MKYLLIKLIKLYQLALSPLLGNECRFSPTCSRYAVEAIDRHGTVRGFVLAVKRLARCNPWNNRCGLDPVE